MSGGAGVVAGAAPEVEFVGEVGSQRPGGHAEPVRELEAAGKPAVARAGEFAELLAETGVGRRVGVARRGRPLNDGEEAGPRDPCLLPGPAAPRDRLGQVEVRGEDRIHDGVEHGSSKDVHHSRASAVPGAEGSAKAPGSSATGTGTAGAGAREQPVTRRKDANSVGAARPYEDCVAMVIRCNFPLG